MEVSSPLLEDPALEAYEGLAPFYDLFTAGYSYDTLLAELERLALDHGLAGRRLLDVGCGTGKSFLPMLARGYEVTGCDLSPAMVEQAREKLPPGLVELFVADMRDLPVGRFLRPHHLPRRLSQLPGGPGRPRARPSAAWRRTWRPAGLLVFDVNTLSTYRGAFAAHGVRESDGVVFCWRGQAPARLLPRAPRSAPSWTCSARRTTATGAGSPSTTASATCPARSWSPPCMRRVCELLAVRGLVPGGHLVPDADEDRHVKLVFLARTGAGAPCVDPRR